MRHIECVHPEYTNQYNTNDRTIMSMLAYMLEKPKNMNRD